MTPKEGPPQLNVVAAHHQPQGRALVERLVLSIAEAAEALGVSDDLVYELTERGDLPRVRLGRRKVIPRRAIQLVVDAALDEFDPTIALTSLDRAKPERASRIILAELPLQRPETRAGGPSPTKTSAQG